MSTPRVSLVDEGMRFIWPNRGSVATLGESLGWVEERAAAVHAPLGSLVESADGYGFQQNQQADAYFTDSSDGLGIDPAALAGGRLIVLADSVLLSPPE